MTAIKTVGWVGCGIMGVPMAKNLMKNGVSLVVYNRTPDKCHDLVALGATLAPSARDVAAQSDVVFAMVSDPDAAREVALGEVGVVAGLTAGKGYVDVSTVDVATVVAVSQACHAAGAQYLEAPVSGSKGPAENAQLIFLCGGDEELYTRTSHLLDFMGKAKFFLGEVGQGAKMKLVVNLIMGSMMGALAEGIALAPECGLDPKTLVDVLGLGAMAMPMVALKGKPMTEGSYPTAFPLKHQQKDMRLALEEAERLGQTLPVAAAAHRTYQRASELGHANDDFSAILTALLDNKGKGLH